MLPVGSLVSDAATGIGLLAATIAVCGFIGQVPAALKRKDDQTVRVATVIGGLGGFFIASAIIVADKW